MKIRSEFFLFLVIPIFFLFSLPAAGDNTNIANSPGWDSSYPRIAVDSSNDIHVLWVEEYSTNSRDVFYARYDSANQVWSAPKNLSNNNKVYSDTYRSCAIAVDDADKVYAVWTQKTSIVMKVFSGGSWGSSLTVATSSAEVDCPRVAVRDNGNIYIIWYTLNGKVYSKAKVNGSWEGVKMISVSARRSKFPDIAAGNNLVYASWVEKSGGKYSAVYAKRNKGYNSSWSGVSKVYNSSLSHSHAVIELDSSDNPHIVWTSYVEGPRVVKYSHWTGSGFTTPVEISSTRMIHYPAIDERNNDIYVCWQIGGYSGGRAIHYNLRKNSDWGGQSAIPDSSGGTFSDVASNSDGDEVYFVWDGKGDIYFHSTGAMPIPNIPPVAKFSFSPNTGLFPLKVSFNGSNSHDPDGTIVRYDWDFGDGGTGSGKTINYIYQTWGTFPITLSVVDNDGAVGTEVKAIEILRLFQPLNIRYESFLDESLFFSRYVTEIYWERNPKNDNIAEIVFYRIYKKRLGESDVAYRCIGEVDANTFNFRDTDVDKEGIYVYTVTSLDSEGHESPIVESTGGAILNDKSYKKFFE